MAAAWAAYHRVMREGIADALAAHEGNTARAARAVGLRRSSFLRSCAEYGLDVVPGKAGRPPRHSA